MFVCPRPAYEPLPTKIRPGQIRLGLKNGATKTSSHRATTPCIGVFIGLFGGASDAAQQSSIEFATFYYDYGRNCRLSGRGLRAGVELSMRGSEPSGERVSAARRYAAVYTTLKPVVERNQNERRRLLIMRRRRRKCEAIVWSQRVVGAATTSPRRRVFVVVLSRLLTSTLG